MASFWLENNETYHPTFRGNCRVRPSDSKLLLDSWGLRMACWIKIETLYHINYLRKCRLNLMLFDNSTPWQQRLRCLRSSLPLVGVPRARDGSGTLKFQVDIQWSCPKRR